MFQLIVLSFFQSLLLTATQVLLQASLRQFSAFHWSWVYFKSVLTNYVFALTGICALSAMLLWLYLLKKYELSIVYPLTSMSFVFGLMAAQWILHEPVPATRWLGVVIIMVGVFFVVK